MAPEKPKSRDQVYDFPFPSYIMQKMAALARRERAYGGQKRPMRQW
jgi:hypothetical protein